ncbi:hypothetical protein AB0F59_34155, partial [Micromonospora lupini]|uniref:hypothetical protein n=2 Tax=cellular organisms TaxID=131567 RepID=UPI0033DCE644
CQAKEITMDKLREEFEEWFNKQMVLHISASNEIAVSLMWKAWRASRAGILVELPDTDNYWNGTSGNEIFNHRQFAADSCDALRDIGLSIKGE